MLPGVLLGLDHADCVLVRVPLEGYTRLRVGERCVLNDCNQHPCCAVNNVASASRTASGQNTDDGNEFCGVFVFTIASQSPVWGQQIWVQIYVEPSFYVHS